jgi:hypothetical protein
MKIIFTLMEHACCASVATMSLDIVFSFIHTLGTWKKYSIHLVCPWGKVLSQGVFI